MKEQAPTDTAAIKAWDRIAAIAREHCLVVGGFGGHMTLATPDVQREHGLRDKVLSMHGRTEHPSTGQGGLEL